MNRPAVFFRLMLLIIFVPGCGGNSKTPRVTAGPVIGYPYPFGVQVRFLFGKDSWPADERQPCPNYVTYTLANPPPGTRWSRYRVVHVTADKGGTLQGFSATPAFTSDEETQSALRDLLNEIRRRYGPPTDSTKVANGILRRSWQDREGNRVTVDDRMHEAGFSIHSVSAKLVEECPPAASEPAGG